MQSQDYKISSPSAGSPLPISGTEPAGVSVSGGGIQGGPNTVLRVIVESLLYPVSLDILHQIFQRFGKVLKIVTFTKNNSFQVRSNRVCDNLIIMCFSLCISGPHPVSGRAGVATRQSGAGRPKHLQRLLYVAHRQQQTDGTER